MPSPNPISEEVMSQIQGNYQTSVLILLSAELLEEMACRVVNGELGGVEEMGEKLVLLA
jgi:hypothetical protein